MSWRDCFVEWYNDFGRYVDVYRPIHKAWKQIRSFTERNCPGIWNRLSGKCDKYALLVKWQMSGNEV